MAHYGFGVNAAASALVFDFVVVTAVVDGMDHCCCFDIATASLVDTVVVVPAVVDVVAHNCFCVAATAVIYANVVVIVEVELAVNFDT